MGNNSSYAKIILPGKKWDRCLVNTNIFRFIFKKSFWIALGLTLDSLACWIFYTGQQQNLNLNGEIILGLFFCLVLGLFYFGLDSFVFPQFSRLSSLTAWLVVVVCTLLGLYFLTFSVWPVQEIEIFPRHLKIIGPSGENFKVQLLSFQTEKGFVSYKDLNSSGTWLRSDNNSLTSASPQATLDWEGYLRDSSLVFKGSENGGKVTIVWDDQTISYDLSDPAGHNITIHNAHPITQVDMLVTVILTVPLLLLSLILLVSILILFSHDLNDQNLPEGFSNPWQNKNIILDIFWGLAGILLFLGLTRVSGLWVLSDSLDYLSAARHLLAGQGYIGMDRDLYIWWPPLVPAVLALFHGGLRLQDMLAVRLLYILIAGFTFGLYSFILRKMIRSVALYGMGMLILLVSIPFWSVSVTLMSEPIFLLFEAFFFLFWIRWVQRQYLTDLLLLVLSSVLLALTRYPGAFFSFVLALILFFTGQGHWFKRLMQSILASALSLLPLAVWIVRNYLSKGVLTGKRPPSTTPLIENIRAMLGVISSWFLPYTHWLFGFIFLGLLSAACVVFWGIKNSNENTGAKKIVWSLFIFIWVYMAGLMSSFSTTTLSPVDGQRHYTPLFFPAILLLLLTTQPLFERNWAGKNTKLARGAILCVLGLGLINPVWQFINSLSVPVVNNSTSFSIYAYWDHPLIAETRVLADTIDRYPWTSNCKKCLYYAGNQWAVEFYVAPLLKVKKPPLVVVWFKDLVDSDQNPTSEQGMKDWLAQVDGPGLNITQLGQNERGAIYLVEGK